ncbi:MAG: hypothetical protein CMJ46_06670, partial [Planctomyces sp.]|nr:hypothetical protein [Planctomyces sp.]
MSAGSESRVRTTARAKATGEAKFTADIMQPDTLHVRALTSVHAHARIKLLEIDAAKEVPGVEQVLPLKKVGDEVLYDGDLIVLISASRPEVAQDGIRAIKIEYEPLPFFVDESDLDAAIKADATVGPKGAANGDSAAIISSAAVVPEGYYGLPTISHVCLEPHGAHCERMADAHWKAFCSSENVVETERAMSENIGEDEKNLIVQSEYVGGGYGSKLSAGPWELAVAELAKSAPGNRPVRYIVDRATEMKAAGLRTSAFAKVRVAADAGGRLTAFEADLWGSSGNEGETIPPDALPYGFKVAARSIKATGIKVNGGTARPFRGSHHPHACLITQAAFDDLAAIMKMDPLNFFQKNIDGTWYPELYTEQLRIAAELIGWKENWKPREDNKGQGTLRRGLGLALHQWSGRPVAAELGLRIKPDGTVETFTSLSDTGTGVPTSIALVVAEMLGLSVDKVKVNSGWSDYPQADISATTDVIATVTKAGRAAAEKSLAKIFELVAKKYEVDARSLTASAGQIGTRSKPVCSWEEATALIGETVLEVVGAAPEGEELISPNIGGVQMAEVTVDIETGLVKINRIVAVQDGGRILDRTLAETDVKSGVIMGISNALFEERILDNKTGRYINADFFNYRMARSGDIGEITVELFESEETKARGVLGFVDPPIISTATAISNAVANAIGVRVPTLPLTPDRVLDALEG